MAAHAKTPHERYLFIGGCIDRVVMRVATGLPSISINSTIPNHPGATTYRRVVWAWPTDATRAWVVYVAEGLSSAQAWAQVLTACLAPTQLVYGLAKAEDVSDGREPL